MNAYVIDSFLTNYSMVYGVTREERENIREHFGQVTLDYLQMFYCSKVWHHNRYRGLEILKFPIDLWIFQEIVSEMKPDIVIETGTYKGGSALWYADLLQAIGNGKVISIDIEQNGNLPQHDRITYLKGSSVDISTIDKVKEMVEGKTVMVDLDSNHFADHVIQELKLFGEIVTPSQYMIVEDTIIGGHPVNVIGTDGKIFYPGPLEAVKEYMDGNTKFVYDRIRERYGITANMEGFLRRRNEG